MITATVSHEMRTPINAILLQLESLEATLMEKNGNKKELLMIRVIKNSAKLLLYLVQDMLDVYMLKNGKFTKIEEYFVLE